MPTTHPYLDPALSVAERVADLLSRLTLEEKAGQLTQYFYTGTGEPLPDDFDIESLPPEHRVHVELPARIEAAINAGRVGSLLFLRDPALSNRLQRRAVEESRLGIPLLFGFDVVHGWRTVFPVPIALAATWSASTVAAAQTVAAREARAAGVHWTFAPMIDVARDPRWGRIVEGAGEDPVLGAVMAAAQVRGFQGDLGRDRLLAGPKHFLAVIGQLADAGRDLLGPWVFAHDTAETVTILDGLTSRLGSSTELRYEAGAGLPERLHPSPFDTLDPTVERTPADHDDDAAIDRAVALASSADVTIVVVGQRQNQIGETASASTLDLPGRQLEQLQRIQATGTTVVLVVVSGRPLDLRWADEHVPAILQAWYPGTRGGDAVASILLGESNPAGRLPFTWPRHVGQVPLIYSHYRTFAPESQDARYYDESSAPLYPFGHGLSYSTFAYQDLCVEKSTVGRGDSATVSVEVSNTGERDGDEVVQLYVHQRYGTSSRPVRELKDFTRISLSAGESRRVRFTLDSSDLRYWSAVTGGFVQDATTFDVGVGGSSSVQFDAQLTVTL